MSRFQSRLFNWIERSLPVELGRKTRRIFDKFTRKLADKLAQIFAEPSSINGEAGLEPSPQRLPSSWRALLKPAYALVRYLVGGTQVQRTKSEHPPVVEGIVVVEQTKVAQEVPNTHDLTHDRRGEPDRSRDYVRRLNELLERAIAYFRKRQRALPTPTLSKAEQEAIVPHSQIPYEEPTVPWLDDTKLLKPEPSLTIIAENNLPEADAWDETNQNHSMRAWLESQVLLINYGDSWGVKLLLWLDRLVAKIEKWLYKLWQKIVSWWQSKFTKI